MHRESEMTFPARVGVAIALMLGVTVEGARADDTWTGQGHPDNQLSTGANWASGSPPGTGDSNLFFVPDLGDSVCEYDWPVPTWNFNITLTGSNPTVFTMHAGDDDFLPNQLIMEDYSKIDADVCVDVQGSTLMSGRVTIDVANTPTGFVSCCLDDMNLDEFSATLSLTGEAHFRNLTVDSSVAHKSLRFTLDDGGAVFIDGIMWLDSEWSTTQTAEIVALVLYQGSITADNLRAHGGQTADRRVAFDLDDNMTVRTKTILGKFINHPAEATGGGIVAVDIDADHVFEVGELVLEAPCTLKVSGRFGLGSQPGQLQATTAAALPPTACTCE